METYYINKRTIYAYISDIISVTRDKSDGKWILFYDCIWNDNGCPIRSPFNAKKFDTEEEARKYKVGDLIDKRKEYSPHSNL